MSKVLPREPVDELTRRGLLAGGLSLATLMAGGGMAAAGTADAGSRGPWRPVTVRSESRATPSGSSRSVLRPTRSSRSAGRR